MTFRSETGGKTEPTFSLREQEITFFLFVELGQGKIITGQEENNPCDGYSTPINDNGTWYLAIDVYGTCNGVVGRFDDQSVTLHTPTCDYHEGRHATSASWVETLRLVIHCMLQHLIMGSLNAPNGSRIVSSILRRCQNISPGAQRERGMKGGLPS